MALFATLQRTLPVTLVRQLLVQQIVQQTLVFSFDQRFVVEE